MCVYINLACFNMVQDSSLLEFAWIELLEKNKSVTPEELAEVLYLRISNFCYSFMSHFSTNDVPALICR